MTKRDKIEQGSIERTGHALAVIKRATNTFFGLFGLQLVVASVLAFYIEDAWINVIATLIMLFLTFRIRKYHTRAALILLSLLVIIFIVIGIINALARGYPGGALIFNTFIFWEILRVGKALHFINKHKPPSHVEKRKNRFTKKTARVEEEDYDQLAPTVRAHKTERWYTKNSVKQTQTAKLWPFGYQKKKYDNVW